MMKDDVGLLHKLVRTYTFNSPINRGKYRLSDLAMKFSKELQGEITVQTSDGRELIIDSSNGSYKYIYFLGAYEPVISGLFNALVQPGDICLDVGANIGWYSTLFQKLVGENGEVHAFEPVPPIFEHLRRNVEINEPPYNVRLNNFALGDIETDVELHIFPDLPAGHASIGTFNRADYETFPSRMLTLNGYLEENKIENIKLVKIDIEGSELMMLKGATNLFLQENLPILEIEMALATSSDFNYLPNDLIQFIRDHADYRFFAIDERNGSLKEIDHFDKEDIGANVLCLPTNFDLKPISRWLHRAH